MSEITNNHITITKQTPSSNHQITKPNLPGYWSLVIEVKK